MWKLRSAIACRGREFLVHEIEVSDWDDSDVREVRDLLPQVLGLKKVSINNEKSDKKISKEVHVPGDYPDVCTALRECPPYMRIVIHRGVWGPTSEDTCDVEVVASYALP